MMASVFDRPDNWNQMTPEQKREQRFAWLADSVGKINFVSPEAEKSYKTRLQRLIDAYRVREPDRVPVSFNPGAMPYFAGGMDYYTAIYNYEKAIEAYARFNAEHALDLDNCFVPTNLIPARVFDMLGYKMYQWPGSGIPKSSTGFQFVEGEYMKADEYDIFMKNPSDFWMRTYLPRIFSAFEPFRSFGSLTDILEVPTPNLLPLANPDVQATFQKLIDAGKDLANYIKVTGDFTRQVQEKGCVVVNRGEFAKAPFDTIGDTLRGTQGIMKDMYRQPAKLLEALDVVADMTIRQILTSPASARNLRVFFPLHKGADGWMSQKQFETFYWPSLKKVIDAFINEGYQPTLFVEGSYNTRLESITDFPRGSVHWLFDRTDMAKAKKILGSKFSIEGNVPTSLIVTGTPQDVKEYCRNLIEICAPGGGYILAAGASMDTPKIENLRAMVEAAMEYGVYRK
jgi:uroporphyrinogen-III decarboxylase